MYHPCRGYKPAGFVIITQASCEINYGAVIQIRHLYSDYFPFYIRQKGPGVVVWVMSPEKNIYVGDLVVFLVSRSFVQ